MKKITIKRTHEDGLFECSGKLILSHNCQFCFTKIKDDKLYMLIELETGAAAGILNANIYTKTDALETLITRLNKKTELEVAKAKLKFILDHSELNYPINQPV